MTTDLGHATNIKIGSDVGSVEDVKIEPHVEFIFGSDTGQEKAGCGKSVWSGLPRCRWTYPNRQLTGEQFYQLQSLVGDQPSASVVIDIPTQNLDVTTYTPIVATYQGVMHWPEEGVTMSSLYRWQLPDDGILFTDLEPL